MRGKKGVPHTNPADPPRRRANKAVGHGTWNTDRPPLPGVVGRSSHRLFLRVGRRNWASELVDQTVVPRTKPGTMVYTDEWAAYRSLNAAERRHAAVSHNQGEWARDDDGDGKREVHCNTLEGIWTGLRNFLRPFRGVTKVYLEQYVKVFEWAYRLKSVTEDYLRILLGRRPITGLGT